MPTDNPSNLEEWLLSQVGEEIYQIFFYGYTKKQWGKEPRLLPKAIGMRVPIRLTYDDNYYNVQYQGIPIGGYIAIFERLLQGIPVHLGVDYFSDRRGLDASVNRTVFTGAIDEYFGYTHGALEWRSLRFEEEEHSGDYQGVAAVNYTEEQTPYTRIIEHKHFDFSDNPRTIITKEYPQDWIEGREKYYPIDDIKNRELYGRYIGMIDPNHILGGRLAYYKYYSMAQVIAAALKLVQDLCGKMVVQ